MASTALSLGGALIGSFFGPVGARIGFALGSVAGNLLFPVRGPHQEGPRLQNLETMTANEGAPLPIVYGAARVPGVAIWTNGIDESANGERVSGGGKGGAPGGGSVTTYTYSASFAVAFAVGPMDGIRRIWADTKLIWDQSDTAEAESFFAATEKAGDIRVYTGEETQEADPLIVSFEGATTPAFRGVVYVVFEDFQLADFGNRIPSMSAEVVKGAVIDAPIRLTQYSPTIDTSDMSFDNGIFTVPSFEVGSPLVSQTIQTLTRRNLDGDIVEAQTFTGSNINQASNVTLIPIDGNPLIYAMRQEAAGTGSTTSTWGAWTFGAEGLVVPAAPRPYSPDGSLSDSAWSYYSAIGNSLWYDRNVYSENWGPGQNEFGIARYPPGPGESAFPSTIPDAFFSMDVYLVGGSSSVLQLSAGDDGYIYITRAGGGAFLNGDHVIRVDVDLNLVDSFQLESGMGASQQIAAWNGLLVTATLTDGFNTGQVELYDISDTAISGGTAGEAPLLNSTTHDVGIKQDFNVHGIGGGLFIMDDGLWSMTDQIQLAAPTLESIVDDICTRCDLTAGQIDATDLTPTVDGFVINNPMSGRSAIEGLTPAYFFDGFESGAKVKFTLRGGSSVVTIPQDDLGAFVSGPPTGPITRSHQQELELPQQVDVMYMDINQDYEIGAQLARRIITTSVNKVALTLPVVFTSAKAAQVAEIYLQSVWAERDRYSFQLTLKYDYLEPADLVTIPTSTGDILVRLVSIDRGANNLLQVDAVADLSVLYSSIAVGNDAAQEDEQALVLKGPTRLQIIDFAQLRSRDDSPGYYLAATGYYTGWTGASVTRQDAGTDETGVGAIFSAAVCGNTNDTLPDYLLNGTDVLSTVNVSLIGLATLSSITEAQFLAGGNAAVIGDEIVSFKTATLEGDGTYTLSYLHRGRDGSPATGHTASDRFILIESLTLVQIDGELADSGASAKFLAYTFGAALSPPSETSVTLQNGRIKPRPPVHAFANRELTGDYKGQFDRQARFNTEWMDAVDVPLDETTEAYEVDVLNGSTVVRTISVDSSRAFTYTRAQQIADFSAVQSSISLIAYQMSDRVGRGFPVAFTGTIPANPWTDYDNAVLADIPIIFALLNTDFKLTGLVGGLDYNEDRGDEGVDYDYTEPSPLSGDDALVLEHVTSTWNIDCDESTAMNAMTTAYSVEFMFKHGNATSGSWMSVLARMDFNNPSGSGSMWAVFLETNDRDDLTFRATPAGGSFQEIVTSGEAVNDDAWHHAVVVWDNVIGGTHKMYIYVDGLEAASATISAAEGTATNTATQVASIGERADHGTDTQYVGAITRPAMYDYALTAGQVSAHFTESGL